MPLLQTIEGCLEASIGGAGLPQTSLDHYLERLRPRLASLREAYAAGTLPVLRVPEWRDDIAPARDALAALSKDARTLVFFGTGGSSLGGQALAQLGGWGIPGDDGNGGRNRPRTRFYDNLDARTLELALAGLDLATTRFVVISKSGNTPETLVQAIAAIEAVRASRARQPHPGAVPRPDRAGGERQDQWLARPLRSPVDPHAASRPQYRRPFLRAYQCRAAAGACPWARRRGFAGRRPDRGRGPARSRRAQGLRAGDRCRNGGRPCQGARHPSLRDAPL